MISVFVFSLLSDGFAVVVVAVAVAVVDADFVRLVVDDFLDFDFVVVVVFEKKKKHLYYYSALNSFFVSSVWGYHLLPLKVDCLEKGLILNYDGSYLTYYY